MKAISLRFSMVAALCALALAARDASALDLAAVGKGFASDLAGEASKCKSKLAGINIDSVKAVFGCLIDAVKVVGKKGLVALLQALYGEGVALLKDKAPLAKAKLKELGDRLALVLPAAKAFVDPVINGIVGAGGDALVAEAGKCKAKLTDLTLAVAKSTFECLGTALKTAGKTGGVAVLHGLFDEFVKLLPKGCALAAGKLSDLAAKAASLLPAARGLLDQAIVAIKNGCSGAVDKVAALK